MTNLESGGKYDHVLNDNGTYIKPKDFLDEFHIHMHQNRQIALQGMTKEEMEIAEKCVQHMEKEQSYRPHVSRNAFVTGEIG